MIIQNRFGRVVSVSDELGREMIKKDGAILYEPEMNETAKEAEENNEKNPLECPYCSKICGNKLGFNKHTKACKKKVH